MVESPDIRWKTLAHMSNHKLNIREAIKDSIPDKAQSMYTDASREHLRSPTYAIGPELFMDSRRGQTRMHVHRNVKVLNGFPENIVFLVVVVEHRIAIGSTGLPCYS